MINKDKWISVKKMYALPTRTIVYVLGEQSDGANEM